MSRANRAKSAPSAAGSAPFARDPLDTLVDAVFGTVVFAIGAANLWLVHPVPGAIGLVLSLVYVRPVRRALERTLRLRIPRVVRIALGVAVVWFTLGVSDLGDMID
ncbi:hypothetical protein [Cognatilysobacter tabacisoli]|uniref:hypothetical protein n=1 Tax=Cognatilysobacter tabacisoli TaxID=2315424 RepID=UPI0018C88FCE|nr:hypothetical protein [Lysobacter tabacisoli]